MKYTDHNRRLELSSGDIDALKRGDVAAWKALMAHWAPYLHAVLRLYVRSSHDRDAVINEVWCLVHNGIMSLDVDPERLPGLISKAAVWRRGVFVRRRTVRERNIPTVPLEVENHEGDETDVITLYGEDRTTRPDIQADCRDRLRLVDECLRQCTVNEQRAFIETALSNDHSEIIAQGLGIARGSVRTMASAVRQRIRQRFRQLAHEEGLACA